ncbi:MAG: hypothetical protein AB1758_22985, partial [Candidatus Eremiobacterota bacterium]
MIQSVSPVGRVVPAVAAPRPEPEVAVDRVAPSRTLSGGRPVVRTEDYPAVDPEALGLSWTRAMPGSHAAVSVTRDPRSGATLVGVQLRTGQGEKIASAMQVFRNHPDGSLEMHLGNIAVEPPFRESGLAPRAILNQLDLLRRMSDHPESRFTLRAAGYTPGLEVRSYGTYVWAHYGLWEFSKPECLPEQKAAYSAWLARQPGLSPELRSQLEGLSRSWTHPHDIAAADMPGITFPVTLPAPSGSEPQECRVGKAYLLSEEAPAWYGVCYVNRPPTPQAVLGLEILKSKLEKADRAERERDRSWEARLSGGDRSVVQEISRSGGVQWISRLEALGEAEAARVLRGELLAERMRALILSSPDERERCEALDFYHRRRGPLEPTLTDPLLAGDSPRLISQLHHYAHDGDPGLEERCAGVLLERFPVREDSMFWTRARRIDAARSLAKLGRAEELRRLTESEPDPVVRQAAGDLLAALQGAEPRG